MPTEQLLDAKYSIWSVKVNKIYESFPILFVTENLEKTEICHYINKKDIPAETDAKNDNWYGLFNIVSTYHVLWLVIGSPVFKDGQIQWLTGIFEHWPKASNSLKTKSLNSSVSQISRTRQEVIHYFRSLKLNPLSCWTNISRRLMKRW